MVNLVAAKRHAVVQSDIELLTFQTTLCLVTTHYDTQSCVALHHSLNNHYKKDLVTEVLEFRGLLEGILNLEGSQGFRARCGGTCRS